MECGEMVSQRVWNAHPHLAWAMWGLQEIEATLASLEGNIHEYAETHPTAESAITLMRKARDAFQKAILEHRPLNEIAPTCSKSAFEGEWAAFEESLETYMDSVGRQISEQERVFRVRADAQAQAWQQAIDHFHESAATFSSERRRDIEAAIRRLGSEADASKAALDKLNKAEGASWTAMKSALSETRAALDRAHHAAREAMK
jgi:hypothetical protein